MTDTLNIIAQTGVPEQWERYEFPEIKLSLIVAQVLPYTSGFVPLVFSFKNFRCYCAELKDGRVAILVREVRRTPVE